MADDSAAAAAAGSCAAAAFLDVPQMPTALVAAASMPGNSVAVVDLNPPRETLMESIKRLKDQQAVMKAEKKNLQKELKNACKRKHRLKKRARQLTDSDLFEVLRMRKDTTAVPTAAESAAAAAEKDECGEDAHMSG